MTRLAEVLTRACRDLRLRIVAPCEVALDGIGTLSAEALLPDLGAPKGMLVLRADLRIAEIGPAIITAGYGYCVLDDPAGNETFELDSFVAMFSDWGWSGPSCDRPAWMT